MRAMIGSRGAWAGLVFLAGCATEPPAPPPPMPQPPPAAQAPAPQAAVPAPVRPPPAEPSAPLVKPPPSPTESMLSPGSATPPGTATASIPPAASLIGLSMADLEARLGRPAAAFERAPAKVMQYRAGECVLDVYFYLDVARNAFQSLHHEARRDGVQDEGCIRRIQDARRQS